MDMLKMSIEEFITKYAPPQVTNIGREVIHQFLRFGSNTTECRKIILNLFAKYPSTEVAEYLPRLYHGGYGIDMLAARYTAWYAADGMHIMMGDSAKDDPAAYVMPWLTMADTIGNLIEAGSFATITEVDEAPALQLKQIAQTLWYTWRDIDTGNDHLLPTLKEFNHGGFPDATARIAEALADEDMHAKITQELREFVDAYNGDHSIMRFQFHKPNELLQRVEDLALDHVYYDSHITSMNEPKSFITTDEIVASIKGGSCVSGGKLRIFRFFNEHKDAKQRIQFLRNEYGIGCHSHALSGANHSDESHDSKGIVYSKRGCEKITLSWDYVAMYIDVLMARGEYLNAKEREQYELDNMTMNIEEFITKYAS